MVAQVGVFSLSSSIRINQIQVQTDSRIRPFPHNVLTGCLISLSTPLQLYSTLSTLTHTDFRLKFTKQSTFHIPKFRHF